MNERINELVNQASVHATSNTTDGGKKFDMDKFHEKFAELIVKDCISILETRDQSVILNSVKEIKEHFGLDGKSTT